MCVCVNIYRLPWWLSGKEPTWQYRRHGFSPWVGKTAWRRKWQPSLVFLPGEFHGQRSLVGNSPWDQKESDKTEQLNMHTHITHTHTHTHIISYYSVSVQLSSVVQSCLTLCNPMNCSMPGLPVHHQLPESTQTHVHWVGDAIQPSHPLSSPSPPAPNPSQHQGLFKWVSSSHQVTKVLESKLQHQSFQWTPRTDFL